MIRLILVACVMAITMSVVFAQELPNNEQKYELKIKSAKGDICTVDLTKEVNIDLNIFIVKLRTNQNQPIKIKRKMNYVQQVLEVDENNEPTKIARHYEKDSIDTNQPNKQKSLEGKTYIVEKTKEGIILKDFKGESVTGDAKIEMTTIFENSYSNLLPANPVKIGDSWDIPHKVLSRLLAGYNSDQLKDVTGKATFIGIEDGDYNSAEIKLEFSTKPKGENAAPKSIGSGRVYFSLDDKKIVGIETNVKIETKGTQQHAQVGAINLTGKGTSKLFLRSTPGKGKIDLTPKKEGEVEKEGEKEEEKKEEGKEEEGEKEGKEEGEVGGKHEGQEEVPAPKKEEKKKEGKKETPISVIHMKDGRKITGRILSEANGSVVVETEYGKLTIPKSDIVRIEKKQGEVRPF
ncbi:hypothetical protein KY317_01445 [Candidatus Woesearchaeota archaeon]|nr:hypothetical protein [Candidatus Woesearchaeota archaeon]